MKPWRTAFLVPSLLALAGTAGAQAQGPVPSEPWTVGQARLIVSAERLFGIHAYSASYEPAEGDATQVEGAMVSLLYGQSAINDGSDSVNPYAVPRIGVDGVLGGAFTIGGSVGFGATTGNIDNGAESGSTSLPAASGFTVYGRFGYLIVPSATVAVWLRGGPRIFFRQLRQYRLAGRIHDEGVGAHDRSTARDHTGTPCGHSRRSADRHRCLG